MFNFIFLAKSAATSDIDAESMHGELSNGFKINKNTGKPDLSTINIFS